MWCLGGSTHTNGSILLVSAAARARRIPETAVLVGALAGVRSVSCKLVGADVGTRFGAVRSKHGWTKLIGQGFDRSGDISAFVLPHVIGNSKIQADLNQKQ